MSEEKRSKHSKRHSHGHSHSSSKTTLSDHEELMQAVDSFIRSHNNFESSSVLNTTIEIIGMQSTLQEVFTVVLQHRLLNMEGALLWTMFLSLAPARAESQGDKPFSSGSPFSSAMALATIASVYDIGTSDLIDEHFEYDSESESDSSEDSPTVPDV